MITFVFWDVQHGSAAYIKTSKGQHIVIDLGTGSYSADSEFSPLLHLKHNWSVEQLDGVIITHPHRDHLDDIFNFYKLSPKFLIRPMYLSEDEIRTGNRYEDQETIDEYLRINRNYISPINPHYFPFLESKDSDFEIKTFVSLSCPTSNLNNHSIVTIISYLGLKMLIPGDNESSSWNKLLEQDNFLSAIKDTDILVAPHHGRLSGFSPILFNYIYPKLTIISDGQFCDTSATNRYAQKTQGWIVHKRSGGSENRKCVTTRNDGVIVVNFSQNNDSRFIEVRID